MYYLIILKWASILLLNLSGLLKIIPILLLGMVAIVELIYFKINKNGFYLIFFILLIFTQKLIGGINLDINNPTTFESISFLFVIFVLPFLSSEINYINKLNKDIIFPVINIVNLFLISDLLIRFYIYGNIFIDIGSYTDAKVDGLFPTSNVSGGLAFLSFCYYLNAKFNKGLIISIILLLGSLSRVSMLAAVFITIIFLLKYDHKKTNKIILIVLFSSFFLYNYYDFYDYLYNDGSFISKINLIISGFDNLFSGSDYTLVMLGMPLDSFYVANALDIQGWSPHVSFLKALLYYGLVGFLLWILVHMYIWKKSHQKYVVIGGLIMGLAGLPILWPPLVFSIFPKINSKK